MPLLKSLHNRLFFLLWSGQTLSRFGDRVYQVALVWWVLQKTGSAAAVAKILIFSYLPMLLFLLVGGIAIDRFSRSKVMLASDLSRAAVVFVVSIFAVGGQLEVWHLYIASGVFGTVDAFFQPAYTVIVTETVPTEALPSANSLTNLSKQIADVAGPALGASIVALVGTPVAFVIDGLSFIASALCLLPLLGVSVSRITERESPNALKELREGFSTVFASPWLWISIAVASIANVTVSGPMSVALPFLIKNDFHRDVGTFGTIYSMLAFGSVVITIWLGRAEKIRHRGLTFYVAFLIAAIMTVAIGCRIPIAGVGIATFIIGATLTASALIWTNTLQELVSQKVLGRVSSIDYLGSYGLLPIGYAATGWATDHLGASLVFIIGGSVTSLLALLALSSRTIRHLD
jgi:DHA3 family tetracycline resistance protein-like MFS transporter